MPSLKPLLLTIVITVALAACSILPDKALPKKTYDFGLLPRNDKMTTQPFPADIAVGEVAAAPWLQNTHILYRFAYTDAAQLRSYTRSRWISRPAKLLGQRLSAVMAASGHRCTNLAECANINITIQRLEQVFTGPGTAHVLLQARVSVTDADQQHLIARRIFRLRAKTPTADAPGAVKAFIHVTDRFVSGLAQWLQRMDGSRAHPRHDSTPGRLSDRPG